MAEDNDKRVPVHANENRWYCLATLYGEHNGKYPRDDIAKKIALLVNQWFANSIKAKGKSGLYRFRH